MTTHDIETGDRIHILRRDVSNVEEEIEHAIAELLILKDRAHIYLEEAGQLVKIADDYERPMLKAMQRRAENVKDLACKMHSMTMRF